MEFDLEFALTRLKQDFIESSLEKLDDIDNIINLIYDQTGNRGELFFQLQRDVHSIKGSAGTHGLHLLTLVAHRLEDYIEAAARLNKKEWRNVQVYIDEMRKLVVSAEEPGNKERENILLCLPHAQTSANEISHQTRKKITILIVIPAGVQRKLIGSELAACGFDLSFSDNPVEALSLIMDLKPNAVLSNQEFRNMTGLELANVLKVVKLTKNTPFALLTSSQIRKDQMPKGMHIIKKGQNFTSDLTDYLVNIGLFGQL